MDHISQVIQQAKPQGNSSTAETKTMETLFLMRSETSHQYYEPHDDLLVSKLNLRIEYEKQDQQGISPKKQERHNDRAQDVGEVLYEKETSVQRMIPKKGSFTAKAEAVSELKRGLEYLAEKDERIAELLSNKASQETRLVISIDLFWENETLRDLISPLDMVLIGRELDFDEMILRKSISRHLEMNSEIIDYLQHGTAKVEIRLYLEDSVQRSTGRNKGYEGPGRRQKYVIVCGCRIPLLEVLTSQDGIKGEFTLVNNMEDYCGLIGLQLGYNKDKEVRQRHVNKEKTLHVVALSFNELITFSESENGATKMKSKREERGNQVYYFEFEVEGETKKSVYYSIDRLKGRVCLKECYFIFTIDSHSEFFQRPVSIGLFQMNLSNFQKRAIGFGNLDFSRVLREYVDDDRSFVQSFYCPLADAEKAKILTTRVGIKVGILKARTRAEAKRLAGYIAETFNGNVSRSSMKYRVQDTRMTGTLSKTKLKETFRKVY